MFKGVELARGQGEEVNFSLKKKTKMHVHAPDKGGGTKKRGHKNGQHCGYSAAYAEAMHAIYALCLQFSLGEIPPSFVHTLNTTNVQRYVLDVYGRNRTGWNV